MSSNHSQIADSVRARLKNIAKKKNQDVQLVFTHYAIERLLYRLSISPYSEMFILKGAMLFVAWEYSSIRPTRDVDFLAFVAPDLEELQSIFKTICALEAQEDGLVFDTESVVVHQIRKDNAYGGIRIRLLSTLENAKMTLQIDVGIGDAVTPAATFLSFPTLLADFPAPQIKTYPAYTVIAEKLETMIKRGLLNSRLKDYFDIWMILREQQIDTEVLVEAVANTFSRRKTEILDFIPEGLTTEFSEDKNKQIQWQAFVRRNLPENSDLTLNAVVKSLADKLGPVLQAARIRNK